MRDVRVAVVVDYLQDYQIPLVKGIEAVLRPRAIALLLVVSHPQDPRRDRVIHRMMETGYVQGVIFTGMSDPVTGVSRVAESAGPGAGVHRITLGLELPGVTAVLPDNIGGVRTAMAHLVDGSGRRSPMFVAGPPDNDDSRERETAFWAVVAERDLRPPARPVVHAGFQRENAYRRMVEILPEGRDFDAVVAANDNMAMGVLDALHEYGVRIPEDVAVVGFDNTAGTVHASPPLSSVDTQLPEQGRVAAEHLLAQLDGESVVARVRVASTLMIRESSAPALARPRPPLVAVRSGAAPAEDAGALIERLLDDLSPVVASTEVDVRAGLTSLVAEWLPGVLAGGVVEPERTEAQRQTLHELVAAHPEPLWWRELVVAARAALPGTALAPDRVRVVRTALLHVALQIERALAEIREQRDYYQHLSTFEHVLDVNRALSECRSISDLTREISAYLPRLNVGRCFLVLLEPRAAAPVYPARLVLAFRNGARLPEPDPEPYPIDDLLPPSLAAELGRGTLAVQQLFTDDRWFGLILHEQDPLDQYTSEALRRDVSAVLDSVRQATELEALVAERTVQLELEVTRRRNAQESLREANAELRRAILLDGLTGLQNRPSFDEHLTRSWHRHLRSGEPLSVLMVDVDNFKLFNDTYGHLAGDQCLREVATCLRAAVIRREDIVARFGGEEFAVVLPGTGLDGARLVAQRLLTEVRNAAIPHSGSSTGSRLSISVGIGVTGPPGVDSAQKLVSVADAALYRAKRSGRDRVADPGNPPAPPVLPPR